MLLDQVLENLGLEVDPFATCAVATGWRLRLPAHPLVTVHYVLRGEGRLIARGTAPLNLPTHSLAVVPAGLRHHLESGAGPLADGEPRAWMADGLSHLRAGPEHDASLLAVCGAIRVTLATGPGLFDHLSTPVTVGFSDRPRMRAIFEALLDEQTSEAPGRVAMMATLMQQCLIELFRRLCERADCRLPWLTALADSRLARALEAIHAAPARPHSLESLAAEAAMSRSAFTARFRTLFGQTPMNYVRDVRLREAARLLRRPELSVDAAASLAGFASRSHFTQAFRRLFKTSPGQYRASL